MTSRRSPPSCSSSAPTVGGENGSAGQRARATVSASLTASVEARRPRDGRGPPSVCTALPSATSRAALAATTACGALLARRRPTASLRSSLRLPGLTLRPRLGPAAESGRLFGRRQCRPVGPLACPGLERLEKARVEVVGRARQRRRGAVPGQRLELVRRRPPTPAGRRLPGDRRRGQIGRRRYRRAGDLAALDHRRLGIAFDERRRDSGHAASLSRQRTRIGIEHDPSARPWPPATGRARRTGRSARGGRDLRAGPGRPRHRLGRAEAAALPRRGSDRGASSGRLRLALRRERVAIEQLDPSHRCPVP